MNLSGAGHVGEKLVKLVKSWFGDVGKDLVKLVLPETLSMTPGQRFKLLRSRVPRSMYSEQFAIIVWFIVSSYILHFCWHRQSCIDSTQSASHLVVSWHSTSTPVIIPLSMYIDMSQNEMSVFGSKMIQNGYLTRKNGTPIFQTSPY